MCFKEQNFNLNKKRAHSYCKYNKSLNNNSSNINLKTFKKNIFIFFLKCTILNILLSQKENIFLLKIKILLFILINSGIFNDN